MQFKGELSKGYIASLKSGKIWRIPVFVQVLEVQQEKTYYRLLISDGVDSRLCGIDAKMSHYCESGVISQHSIIKIKLCKQTIIPLSHVSVMDLEVVHSKFPERIGSPKLPVPPAPVKTLPYVSLPRPQIIAAPKSQQDTLPLNNNNNQPQQPKTQLTKDEWKMTVKTHAFDLIHNMKDSTTPNEIASECNVTYNVVRGWWKDSAQDITATPNASAMKNFGLFLAQYDPEFFEDTFQPGHEEHLGKTFVLSEANDEPTSLSRSTINTDNGLLYCLWIPVEIQVDNVTLHLLKVGVTTKDSFVKRLQQINSAWGMMFLPTTEQEVASICPWNEGSPLHMNRFPHLVCLLTGSVAEYEHIVRMQLLSLSSHSIALPSKVVQKIASNYNWNAASNSCQFAPTEYIALPEDTIYHLRQNFIVHGDNVFQEQHIVFGGEVVGTTYSFVPTDSDETNNFNQ